MATGRVRWQVAMLTVTLHAAGASAQSGRIPIALPGQNRTASPFELAIGRGDAALRRGEFAAAQQEFEAAARLDPHDARPAFYLGEVALRQEHWPVAEAQFRAALRANPQMAEAHAELGNALREQGRNADAIAPLETATRLDPTLAEAHATLAMALEDAGQHDRALTEYRTAVRLAPDAPMPSLNLGIMLAATHPATGSAARAEAFRVLQAAVRNAGDDRTVLINAGPALRMLGEPAAAVSALERARTTGTASAALLGELAQALWAHGDRAAAVQRITEAVRIDPQRAELHYVSALMLAGQGDAAGATAELRRVVQLAAHTPLAERAAARIEALAHPSPAASRGVAQP